MNSIPKMHSIPFKVETNKSTFLLQFPSWRGTSLACNVIRWGTPSVKCTSVGALRCSNWSSILSALSQVMKMWEALVSKKHNASRLNTFPFKNIRWLHSPWTRLVVRAITLEPPFLSLGMGQSLEYCPTSLQLEHAPLGFPLVSPLGWLPFKGACFLTKFPLNLKLEP
jgi:hypothetical protein